MQCYANDWRTISAQSVHTIELRAISARHVSTNEWRAISARHVVMDMTSQWACSRGETRVDKSLKGRWSNNYKLPHLFKTQFCLNNQFLLDTPNPKISCQRKTQVQGCVSSTSSQAFIHSHLTAQARLPWRHVHDYMARAYRAPSSSTSMARAYCASFISTYIFHAYCNSFISTKRHK